MTDNEHKLAVVSAKALQSHEINLFRNLKIGDHSVFRGINFIKLNKIQITDCENCVLYNCKCRQINCDKDNIYFKIINK